MVLVVPMARGGGTLGWIGRGGLGGGLAESVVLGTGNLLGGGGGWAEVVAEGRGSSGEFSNILWAPAVGTDLAARVGLHLSVS